MAEPSGSAYPASLDDATSLLGAVVNQKYVTVSGAVDSTTTTITCSAAISGLNAPGYLINGATGEIIHYGAISGTDFTGCTRGADGSTADSMADGSKLYQIYNAKLHNQLRAATIAVETELGVNPSDTAADVATLLTDMQTDYIEKQVTFLFDGGGAAITPLTKLGTPYTLGNSLVVDGWSAIEMDTDASDSCRIGFTLAFDDDTNWPPTIADAQEGTCSDPASTDVWKVQLTGASKNASAATLTWSATIPDSSFIYVYAHGICDSFTFTGAGLDDMKLGGKFQYDTTVDTDYLIEIQTAGTPDIFHWTDTVGDTNNWNTCDLNVTDTDIEIANGIWVRFGATTGHTAGDKWQLGMRTINDATKVAVTYHGNLSI